MITTKQTLSNRHQELCEEACKRLKAVEAAGQPGHQAARHPLLLRVAEVMYANQVKLERLRAATIERKMGLPPIFSQAKTPRAPRDAPARLSVCLHDGLAYRDFQGALAVEERKSYAVAPTEQIRRADEQAWRRLLQDDYDCLARRILRRRKLAGLLDVNVIYRVVCAALGDSDPGRSARRRFKRELARRLGLCAGDNALLWRGGNSVRVAL